MNKGQQFGFYENPSQPRKGILAAGAVGAAPKETEPVSDNFKKPEQESMEFETELEDKLMLFELLTKLQIADAHIRKRMEAQAAAENLSGLSSAF